MLSFWEQRSFLRYDYIVIGGGITGLSTAISLKEIQESAKVAVIERGLLPTGASTKNAGFACFGSLTELLADVQAMGETAMLDLVADRRAGLNLLRARLGDKAIDLQMKGGYELISSEQSQCMDQMDHVNELLRTHFESNVFQTKDDLISTFGFNKTRVAHLVLNPFEGQIDTGKMMRALQHKAMSMGVELITNTEVNSIEGTEVNIRSFHVQEHCLSAKQIALCTNAFTGQLTRDIPMTPGRGLVLVTKPLKHLKFEGTFHMNEGYDYFRDFYGRVIYGGSRDVAFEEESTTEFGINQTILNELKHRLSEIIIGDEDYEIEHVWSGIMAFGEDKRPYVNRINDHLVAGVRLGGMGVALGSLIGLRLARMLTGDE